MRLSGRSLILVGLLFALIEHNPMAANSADERLLFA